MWPDKGDWYGMHKLRTELDVLSLHIGPLKDDDLKEVLQRADQFPALFFHLMQYAVKRGTDMSN